MPSITISNPASRSERATTVSPRQCPSRPVFARRILGRLIATLVSDPDRRIPVAEAVSEHAPDLAKRHVRVHRLHHRWQNVLFAATDALELLHRLQGAAAVARPAQTLEPAHPPLPRVGTALEPL